MLKALSNLPLPSLSATGPMPAILGVGFPTPATPRGLEKGHLFNEIMRWTLLIEIIDRSNYVPTMITMEVKTIGTGGFRLLVG